MFLQDQLHEVNIFTNTEQTEQNPKIKLLWNFPSHLFRAVQYEALIIWSFIKRDISVILSPIIFTAAAWNSEAFSVPQLLIFLGRAIIVFGLFLLVFCISNQLVGIEEDKINKPDRPLVTGLISPKQAWVHWIVGMFVLSALGWYFGVLPWMISLQIAIILYDFGNWGKHWLGRNVLLVVIAYSSLVAAWTMVSPLDQTACQWILTLSISFGLLINIQELRDLAGDKSVGRRTLPIVIGETTTRISLCIGFFLFMPIVHCYLLMPHGLSFVSLTCDLAQAVMSCLIISRLLLNRSPEDDEMSYQLTSYLYLLLIVGAVTII